jgi:hypothetical protein
MKGVFDPSSPPLRPVYSVFLFFWFVFLADGERCVSTTFGAAVVGSSLFIFSFTFSILEGRFCYCFFLRFCAFAQRWLFLICVFFEFVFFYRGRAGRREVHSNPCSALVFFFPLPRFSEEIVSVTCLRVEGEKRCLCSLFFVFFLLGFFPLAWVVGLSFVLSLRSWTGVCLGNFQNRVFVIVTGIVIVVVVVFLPFPHHKDYLLPSPSPSPFRCSILDWIGLD